MQPGEGGGPVEHEVVAAPTLAPPPAANGGAGAAGRNNPLQESPPASTNGGPAAPPPSLAPRALGEPAYPPRPAKEAVEDGGAEPPAYNSDDDSDIMGGAFPLFEVQEWTNPDEDEADEDAGPPAKQAAEALAGSSASGRRSALDRRKHEYTAGQAAFHVFKGNVGAAIFSLSSAYTYAGTLVGTLLIAGGSVVCVHCMILLVRCKRSLGDDPRLQTYGEVAWRAFGPAGRRLVSVFLVVTQFGFCCVYFQFAGGMLAKAMPGSQRAWVSALVLPGTMLTFLPSMKRLIPAAIFATVTTMLALLAVYSYSFTELSHRGIADGVHPAESPWLWPIMVGNIVSAFEGIGLVLPIENSMRDKAAFPRLLVMCFCVITMLYISFGFVGYLAYGTELSGSIITALPQQSFLAAAVRISMAVAILLTYPIQFFPAIQVVEGWLFVRQRRYHAMLSDRRGHLHGLARLRGVWRNLGVRAVISALLGTLAIAVGDQMGLFLALIGGMGGAFLAIILPPLLHLRLCVFQPPQRAMPLQTPQMLPMSARAAGDPAQLSPSSGATTPPPPPQPPPGGVVQVLVIAKDSALVGLGLMVGALSTYFSIQRLLRSLSGGDVEGEV
eukprot:TRINITY_DN35146_c0_g1_i1.p1 TRINITY_DN35146_c0_g1~~TRINITY_DN35146_c0_g1_i1.p1  ORF type:complete len:611 (+),score=181.60 TRINITY_DN35146_c0_g1_i1:110-1942(+)